MHDSPPVCGYYREAEGKAEPIHNLSELLDALEQQSGELSQESIDTAKELLEIEVERLRSKQIQTEERVRKNETSNIKERARILLMKAAYLEMILDFLQPQELLAHYVLKNVLLDRY